MNYHFDVEIAKKYGVNEAIVIENLRFWILKNKANKKHFYDGHYWTYNSMDAFVKLFPFWSYDQIRTILKNLDKKGAVITGNYNKIAYDRTKWYSLNTELLSIWEKSQMNQGEIPNEIGESPIPIPFNNPFNNPFDNPFKDLKDKDLKDSSSANADGGLVQQFFEELWLLYPKKEGKGGVSKSKKEVLYRLGDEVKRCIERYKQHKEGVEAKYIKQGSTFFNGGYVDYLDKNFEQTMANQNNTDWRMNKC